MKNQVIRHAYLYLYKKPYYLNMPQCMEEKFGIIHKNFYITVCLLQYLLFTFVIVLFFSAFLPSLPPIFHFILLLFYSFIFFFPPHKQFKIHCLFQNNFRFTEKLQFPVHSFSLSYCDHLTLP